MSHPEAWCESPRIRSGHLDAGRRTKGETQQKREATCIFWPQISLHGEVSDARHRGDDRSIDRSTPPCSIPQPTYRPTNQPTRYVLGNAQIARFFRVTHASADADRALASYAKAEACGRKPKPANATVERDGAAAKAEAEGAGDGDGGGGGDGWYANPDLHFNRANVLRYREDYAAACRDYCRAAELDPSLPALEVCHGVSWCAMVCHGVSWRSSIRVCPRSR